MKTLLIHVILANAGIQFCQKSLDSGIRRSDAQVIAPSDLKIKGMTMKTLSIHVILANAGIQFCQKSLDSGIRWSDA